MNCELPVQSLVKLLESQQWLFRTGKTAITNRQAPTTPRWGTWRRRRTPGCTFGSGLESILMFSTVPQFPAAAGPRANRPARNPKRPRGCSSAGSLEVRRLAPNSRIDSSAKLLKFNKLQGYALHSGRRFVGSARQALDYSQESITYKGTNILD